MSLNHRYGAFPLALGNALLTQLKASNRLLPSLPAKAPPATALIESLFAKSEGAYTAKNCGVIVASLHSEGAKADWVGAVLIRKSLRSGG